ncbi:MAG: hypothetical protein K6G03_10150 [Lachnospiraceae bacterium]|nr:hypothetical protein [Lachnospiraceae bacterium]
MGRIERIGNIIIGVALLIYAVSIIYDTEQGYIVVTGLLGFLFLWYGFRYFFYYITMARHMVGGKMSLFIGVIFLDLAILTFSMLNVPPVYVMLYLIGAYAFTGAVDILRGLEAKRMESPRWRTSVIHGAFNIAIAIVCLLFIRSSDILVYIFSMGMIISAIRRFFMAFSRTEIVYIP